LWQLHAANETEQLLNHGSVGTIPERQLRPLTALPPDEQRAVWQEAVDTAPDGHVTAVHVQALVDRRHFRVQCSGEQEWYTPPLYIDAARHVLGTIDLDPATSVQAQTRIQATHFYTAMDQALMQDWSGCVWLNPPYAQPLMERFVEKLLSELAAGRVEQAILLTHNYTDTAWFHAAEAMASRICFTKGRIRFVRADGHQDSPTNGQAFFYFGPHPERFTAVFSAFGCIVQPIG
jgi:phage N-6-adenine-methyltransferase